MGENKIRETGGRITRAVWRVVKFVLSVLSLTIVAYVVVCQFYSTDEEKAIKAENKAYEELYPELPKKLNRIGKDLEELSKLDDMIYEDIFNADPPADDPMSSLSIFFGSDSSPDPKLVFYTAASLRTRKKWTVSSGILSPACSRTAS